MLRLSQLSLALFALLVSLTACEADESSDPGSLNSEGVAEQGGATAGEQSDAASEHATDAATPVATDDESAAAPSAAGADLTAQIDAFIASANIDMSNPKWRESLPQPPVFDFPADAKIFWELQTNHGPMRLRLWQTVAPLHVSSTLYLTRLGFYDELEFHRVINGFMAQGGCPQGTGMGGPGYGYNGEFQTGVVHDRPGLLSMANTGRPNSDGSQFFLTFVPTPHLNNKHTLFGEIVGAEGRSTLKKIEGFGSRSGKTSAPVVLEQARFVVE
ncbi:MAG: hypothetical protein DHS20C15_23420 [Planctomycetota bacterium]|nr:MAG: hypothetical protein DHS20C15_23420 [Planctomycetota bacterium]